MEKLKPMNDEVESSAGQQGDKKCVMRTAHEMNACICISCPPEAQRPKLERVEKNGYACANTIECH